MSPKLIIQSSYNPLEVFPANCTIGIHGTPGCFTEESVNLLYQQLFPFCHPERSPRNEGEVEGSLKREINIAQNFVYLVEAEKVVEAVIGGQVERGAFAIANSGSGACVFSMHAIAKYEFEPVAVYGMEVVQCLLSHSNIKDIKYIKQVFAHPQAIEQSSRTLAQKYPNLKIVKGQDSDDTALCAKKISTGELPPTTATIASQTAVQKYGLSILDYGIHHDPFNVTTFLIIKKK